MPKFYVIFARKIIKMPECFDICPKMPEFYIIIARKIFSRVFFFWGGGRTPCCPYPTPMVSLVSLRSVQGVKVLKQSSFQKSGGVWKTAVKIQGC